MAGGFFSGGSSDAVNASVAEAEAAAREAEAARDEINDKFVEFAGQTEEGDYTVPNADDALTTKFLNQVGDWAVPAGSGGGGAESLSELTDVDSNLSPTNDQILQYNSTTSQFEAADPAAAGEVTGDAPITVTNGVISLDDEGVTTAKLGPDAVTNAKIADNAVQQANIATGAIDSTRLTTDAVTTDKIAADAVTNAKLADNSVDSEQLVDLSVTPGKIPTGSISETKLADLAVSNGKLRDEAVTEPKLNSTNTPTAGQVLSGNIDGTFTWVDQSGGGGTDNITASNGLVRTGNDIAVVSTGLTSTQIADDAIITAKITTGAVTSNEIADATIVDGDIAATTITGGKLVNATITATQLATDAVTEVKIANNAVTKGKIIAQAIDEDKLDVSNTGVAGQVLSADGDGTFTWVANGSGGDAYTADEDTLTLSAGNQFSVNALGVDTAEIAAGAITADKITDGVVTGDKLAVSGTEVANSVIATDGSGNLQWASNSGTLAGLSDTNIPASITDRRFLEYSPSEDVWDAVSISDLLNLSDLFDVVETNLQDNQFLRYETSSAKWVNETINIPNDTGATAPLTKVGNNITLPDVSITGSKIVDGTLATAKIADNAITGAKMADLSVDTAELAANAVTTPKIADGAVTASKIPNNSLTAVQLATDSVTSFKIQDGAVIAGKIADNVVGADELNVSGNGSNGQVLTSDGDGTFSWTTNSGGVTYTAGNGLDLSVGNEFSISALGVDTAELAAGAVTEAKIANNAVTTAAIISNAVGADELNVSGNGTSGQVLGSDGDGTFSWVNEITPASNGGLSRDSNNMISIEDGGVTSARLADDSVTTDAIIDAAVTNAKIGTDVPISKLSDVDTSGVNSNQVLGYNGTTWVPVNQSGGGNTDNSRLAVTLVPTSLTEGDANTQVDITLSIANAQTDETISLQSVTVVDPLGHTVTVTGSGNSWMFTGNGTNVGNYVIRASATLTLSGAATGTVHSTTANLPVIASNSDWYQLITATVPTDVASMTDNGTFTSPQTGTVTASGTPGSTNKAYIAVPARTGGSPFFGYMLTFTFSGYPLSVPIRIGTISTNYDLFQINDADFLDTVAGDLNFTITEI